MKALVTGGTGLIGANLVRELLGERHSVRAFVRPTSDLRSLNGLDVEIAYGDVLEADTIAEAAAGCDVLFHCASIFRYWGHKSDELQSVAVDGAINAIEAAHGAGVKRMVLTSSSVILGSSTHLRARDETDQIDDPFATPYASAKAHQERAAFERAEELGLELVAVCPTMAVGPHDTYLSESNAIIVNYLRDPFRTTFSGGCNIVSASDVARGHLLAALKGQPGDRYVLGSQNLEWSMVHRMISELCGVSGPNVHANHTLSFLIGAFCEMAAKLSKQPPPTTRIQAKMVGRFFWYKHDRAAALGFAPIPAREALARAVAWLASSPHISRQLRCGLRLSDEVYRARVAIDRPARGRIRK
jgi:dihydroflavonol-4-reductase